MWIDANVFCIQRLLADVKGKGKEVVIDLFLEPTAPPLVLPTSTCTICFESIILSDSPYLSTINNTTTESLYGMYIGPIADNHVFCLPCLVLTISHKLKNLSSIVFPLTCPGFACNVQITSEIALLVLGSDDMEKWVSFASFLLFQFFTNSTRITWIKALSRTFGSDSGTVLSQRTLRSASLQKPGECERY